MNIDVAKKDSTCQVVLYQDNNYEHRCCQKSRSYLKPISQMKSFKNVGNIKGLPHRL